MSITIKEIKKSKKIIHKDRKIARFMFLYETINELKNCNDNINCFEFGVYNGETINFLSHLLKKSTIYGFDSFEGLPENWIENFPIGTFNRNGKLPEVKENVTLIKGMFQNTLPCFLETFNDKINVLHIDCDIYNSAQYVLNTLKDFVKHGTIIIFDELINYKGYKLHEFKALNEFLKSTGYKIKVICHNNYEQVSIKIL